MKRLALHLMTSVRIAAVTDGAGWIWKHVSKHFPGAQEILDYYHCKEHVYKVVDHHKMERNFVNFSSGG